jgi:Protein of unknown function (DUF2950)
MQSLGLQSGGFRRVNFVKMAAIAVLVAAGFAAGSRAQQKGQKTFATPEEAIKALLTAVQNNDVKALLELFGPDGKHIVSSGDEAEDARVRANFVKRYEEMNRLVKEPDGTISLYIGSHNWPYPIPLRYRGNLWYFDTDAGVKEVLYRRIGYNEISAIHICQELVAAQKEYHSHHNNEYAQKIYSDEGKKDGLYWKGENGEPQSPIGPLVAGAVAEEYAKERGGEAVPYRGYYFHILTSQGKDSSGGAKSYIVDGKMTGGFAFVAYPAEYRSSGVMTFLVDADGLIYEKDLGKKTETTAKAMKEYNPNAGWHQAEEDTQEASSGGATK